MTNEGTGRIGDLISTQDQEYQRGLDNDQMNNNKLIIEKLEMWEQDQEEESRLKRLEYLNNLNSHDRRLFMLGELPVESEKGEESDQKYFNMSNKDAALIDPDHFLVYRLTDYVELAYSLIDLYNNNNIKVSEVGEIQSIQLPIDIYDIRYYYHVNPRFDTQWEYTVLSMCLQHYIDSDHSSDHSSIKGIKGITQNDICNISSEKKYGELEFSDTNSTNSTNDTSDTNDVNKIKTDLKTRLHLFGMEPELIQSAMELVATDDIICKYIGSNYTEEQILERLIASTLQELYN